MQSDKKGSRFVQLQGAAFSSVKDNDDESDEGQKEGRRSGVGSRTIQSSQGHHASKDQRKSAQRKQSNFETASTLKENQSHRSNNTTDGHAAQRVHERDAIDGEIGSSKSHGQHLHITDGQKSHNVHSTNTCAAAMEKTKGSQYKNRKKI